MTAPIVFIDTETTGLHADRRSWEIAMIRRPALPGHPDNLTIVIEDVDLSNADLIALKIGRFHERHVRADELVGRGKTMPKGSILTSEAAAARTVELWTRGAHIVGAVPNFDTETLAAMLRRHGLCPAWHYHLIDVEALAFGWLHGVAAHGHSSVACADSPVDCVAWSHMVEFGMAEDDGPDITSLPWKSDSLSRACGVEPPSEEERHTAMGDACWAMRLYDRIIGSDVAVAPQPRMRLGGEMGA